jgi:hypothetical protein
MERTMTLSNEALYAKALELATNDPDNFWDLGRALRRLLDRNPDLFQKFLDNTDVGSRKAYYLIEINRAFEPLQVSRTRLLKLGWTKLQLIASEVNQDHVEEWLDVAESLSTKQLERKIKGKTPIKNPACVLMYFNPKDYKELAEALKRYGATATERSIRNREEALMRMVRRLKDLEKGNPLPTKQ